jgi:hypothetical protein
MRERSGGRVKEICGGMTPAQVPLSMRQLFCTLFCTLYKTARILVEKRE